ncbi:MAG: hypothetical protein GX222_08390 [Ruminococcaceae bacterium]|nr:hypothetical protein [Oscillospiraceae bacterium]
MNIISGKPTYTLSGKIIKGKKIGTAAGFPTANMDIKDLKSLPPNGVYISVLLWNREWYKGITNVGNRPTVDDKRDISIETHLLDFDKDIYGESVELRLFEKIRETIKFESLDALAEQIEKDKASVKLFFNKHEDLL